MGEGEGCVWRRQKEGERERKCYRYREGDSDREIERKSV